MKGPSDATSEEALVLQQVLQDAGLRAGEHVNVEDGGPILEARIDDLPTPRPEPT